MALIQGVEGLGHIQAVQPDLVGVNLLVPEVALHGAGLAEKLAPQHVGGLAVLLLVGLIIEGEEHAALVDVVQIILALVVGEDGAILGHEMVDEMLGEVEIAALAGDLRHGEQGGDHAAVDVVPVRALALADFLYVPDGALRGGFLDEPQDIIVNLLIHSQFSSINPSFAISS